MGEKGEERKKKGLMGLIVIEEIRERGRTE